ncbi:MAG: hypothetical protein ABIF85_07515 [Nanoarchaeota archaeon]|nr:hypothetical protein [Nanoarchaeota archaeon]MBU4300928.1 hypothetical protein [Nanoarchaeota archaeon]MBU4451527.1 hypothetical protein [Nanoarchaeota archaeon]MCG2723274.1 hypothetical protein [archaeon]
MAFYKPILTIQEDKLGAPKHAIVYIDTKVSEIFDRRIHGAIEEHVYNVYRKNKDRFKTLGQYNIDILWADGKEPMLDIWVMDKIKDWGAEQIDSGALVEAEYTFRNFKQDKKSGIGAGLGMMVLAKEELQRRIIEQQLGEGSSINEILYKYIHNDRPSLDFGPGFDFTPQKEFYL